MGTALLIPLMAFLISEFGLKQTFWLPGIVGGAVLLLLIRPFYNEPAEIGLRPFGAPETEPVKRLQADDTAKIRTRVFFGQARRTGAFWNLIGVHFWGCMGHNIFIVFMIAMAVDAGLSREMAVGAYITLTVFSMIARFLVPIVADRFGTKSVLTVCFVLQAFPPLVLLLYQDPWAFYLFAGLFGIGLGGEVPAFPHHQPPVLRRRSHRHGIRLADAGERRRHGPGTAGRGVPVGPDGRLRQRGGAVRRAQPRRPGLGPTSATHVPAADARLGEAPAAGAALFGVAGL